MGRIVKCYAVLKNDYFIPHLIMYKRNTKVSCQNFTYNTSSKRFSHKWLNLRYAALEIKKKILKETNEVFNDSYNDIMIGK